MLLGDFNIDRKDDPLWQTFTSTGLTVPDALHQVPRTINGAAKGGPAKKHYDQIAYFQDRLSLTCTAAGSIDFVTPLLRRKSGLTELSWRLSDHLPVWVEFGV